MPTIGVKPASVNIRLGKRKDRSQMCKIYTDDRRRVTVEGDVDMGCVVDHARKKAFLQDVDNQYRSRKDGCWYQILGERSTIPICLLKPSSIKDLEKRMSEIYRAQKQKAKFQQYINIKKNVLMERFLWIVAMAITGMILFYAMNHFWG